MPFKDIWDKVVEKGIESGERLKREREFAAELSNAELIHRIKKEFPMCWERRAAFMEEARKRGLVKK